MDLVEVLHKLSPIQKVGIKNGNAAHVLYDQFDNIGHSKFQSHVYLCTTAELHTCDAFCRTRIFEQRGHVIAYKTFLIICLCHYTYFK